MSFWILLLDAENLQVIMTNFILIRIIMVISSVYISDAYHDWPGFVIVTCDVSKTTGQFLRELVGY